MDEADYVPRGLGHYYCHHGETIYSDFSSLDSDDYGCMACDVERQRIDANVVMWTAKQMHEQPERFSTLDLKVYSRLLGDDLQTALYGGLMFRSGRPKPRRIH